MNVAIFGGTFDPVHRGHVEVAKAAQAAYKLDRIYFVPADVPPHKQRRPITPYVHRYAMLALALRGQESFVPSLMESSSQMPAGGGQRPNYSIDTVRRFRAALPKTTRLFFLIGIDAFLDIATWRAPEALLKEVEFIVANRPGFSLRDLERALPEALRRSPKTRRGSEKKVQGKEGAWLAIGGAKLHLLASVAEQASSTRIRAARAGKQRSGLLDEAVVEYIRKEHLYKGAT